MTQNNISQRHQYRKIAYRLQDYVCELPDYMGLQTTDKYTAEYKWGRVHGIITVIEGLHISYVNIKRNEDKGR